ncbi:MAG: DUF6531 domain-containing protein [Acidimicrobiales bacterium]
MRVSERLSRLIGIVTFAVIGAGVVVPANAAASSPEVLSAGEASSSSALTKTPHPASATPVAGKGQGKSPFRHGSGSASAIPVTTKRPSASAASAQHPKVGAAVGDAAVKRLREKLASAKARAAALSKADAATPNAAAGATGCPYGTPVKTAGPTNVYPGGVYWNASGSVQMILPASGAWFLWVLTSQGLTKVMAANARVDDAGKVSFDYYLQLFDYPGRIIGIQLTEGDYLSSFGSRDTGTTDPATCQFWFGPRQDGVPSPYDTPWGGVSATGAVASPESLYGMHNDLTDYAPCSCGDPVDNATGNFSETVTDLSASATSTGGLPLSAARTYNSLDGSSDGPFGRGWSDGYGWSLDATSRPGVVTVRAGDGARTDFYDDGKGGFFSDSAVKATLTSVSGGGYQLRKQPHQIWTFDAAGRLTAMSKVDGISTTLTYSGGRLATVTDAAGRQLSYAYATNGHVTSIMGPGARTVTYGYNGAGDLTAVVDPSNATTSMSYDDSHRMLTLTDPNGGVTHNHYDDQGRVDQQTDAAEMSTTWHYQPGSSGASTTTVTDPNGHQKVFTFQENVLTAQTVGAGSADEATTKYEYGSFLQPTKVTDPKGNVTSFSYDAHGNPLTRTEADSKQVTDGYNAAGDVTSMEDADGTTSYGRAANGLLTSVTDPLNHTTTYAYTAAGEVKTVTTPAQRTTSYDYDTAGNLASRTTPAGEKTTFTEDASGWVTSKTDPRGNLAGATPETYTSHYIYDKSGRLTKSGSPVDTVTATTYDGNGNPTEVSVKGAGGKVFSDRVTSYDPDNRPLVTTNAGRKVETNNYDAASNLLTTTDGTGFTTSYTYDALNRRKTATTPRGNASGATAADYTWTYSYDLDNNQTTVTDPSGRVNTNGYDVLNRPTTVTTAKGETTTRSYDALGRVVSVTDPLTRVTGYGYDHGGRLTSTTAPGLAAETFAYDADGLPTSHTSPSGQSTTSYTYDGDGRLSTRVDSLGNVYGATPGSYTTTYGYDANGNQTSVKNQLGRTTTTTYDADANPLKVTTPRGSVTTRTYDGDHHVTSVKDPLGAVTSYAYDQYDDMVTRTDPGAHTTSYAYNPLHQVTSITDQLNRTRTYGYDADGNVTTEVMARGNVAGATATTASTWTVHQTYDARNLRTAISNTADTSVNATFAYDDDGRLNQFVDTTGTTNLTWDSANQLSRVAGPDGTYSYTYAPSGAVASRTLPVAGKLSYTFDADGRVDSQTANSYTSSYGYDVNDQLTTVTYPTGTGLVETRGYNATGDLTKVVNKKSSTLLSQFDYTLDTDGNPTTIKTTRGSTATNNAFTYDADGHLGSYCTGVTTCTGATQATVYTYDPLGDRTKEVTTGGTSPGTITHTYDAAGERTSKTAVNGTVTNYTYDAAGHLKTGGRTWDVLGRMSSIGTSTPTAIKYNALGLRRTLKTGTNSPTSYSWDLNNPIAMLGVVTKPDATTRANRYDPTGWAEGLAASGQSYTYSYLMNDNQGSITDVAGTTSGTPEWAYSYTAFGSRTATSLTGSAYDTGFGYDSQYLETATGEYNLRARDYNPADAQFHASDPLNLTFSSSYPSPYLYANNQPTTLTDPTGMVSTKGIITGVVIGAALVGTAACVIAEPCGVIEGGVALGAGAEIGGATFAETALTAGLSGAAANAAINTGASLVSGNGIPSLCQNIDSAAWGFLGGVTGLGISAKLADATPALATLSTTAAKTVDIGGAKFAQTSFSEAFSKGGLFGGRTIDDVAGVLRSGAMSQKDVPINVVIRDGNTLITNTRSAQALTRAGIPRDSWNVINRTGDSLYERLLSGQLSRNGLGSAGTDLP